MTCVVERLPPGHARRAAAGAGEGTSRQSPASLEIHVTDVQQLFNSMDPAPFRERDLDPAAEAYIVDWSRETGVGQPLRLLVRLEREPMQDAGALGDAVREYFRHQADATRRRLRRLLRTGRICLVIGLVFIALAIILGDAIASTMSKESHALLVTESFVIGGWVALWKPLEIFLYDWWPIRAEARLYDRLGEMEVRMHWADAPLAAGVTGA